MKRAILFAALCLIGPANIALADQAGSTSLALIVGLPTDVIGVESGYDMSDYLGLRGGLGGVKLSGAEVSGIEAEINTLGGSVFADYYPFGGNFRISAGTHIGKYEYTLSEGSATGSVEYNIIRPAASIGLTTRESSFLIFGDIGLAYQGTPDFDISGFDTATQDDIEFELDRQVTFILRTGIGMRF